VNSFYEKAKGDGGWINGGFFVLSPKVIEYITDDHMIWEKYPLEKLAMDGQLSAYHHNGDWQSMDTLRDKIKLQRLWEDGKAPWKTWK
jgi:glucose-1-phosphate cytidylyltransferase